MNDLFTTNLGHALLTSTLLFVLCFGGGIYSILLAIVTWKQAKKHYRKNLKKDATEEAKEELRIRHNLIQSLRKELEETKEELSKREESYRLLAGMITRTHQLLGYESLPQDSKPILKVERRRA
jgi:uncharacterized protein HemX